MLTLGTTLVEKMYKRTHNAMYFDSNITLTQNVSLEIRHVPKM